VPDPVQLTPSGPPETVIPAAPPDAAAALEAACQLTTGSKAAVAEVAARWPRYLDAWAALGAMTDDAVEAYAYFRVGYHRGLDTLRGAGWRGSGYVRWAHPSNRGFLRCLLGLQRQAAAIGEQDEDERCRTFLMQLDPGGVPEGE
jgi:hypothetical protein